MLALPSNRQARQSRANTGLIYNKFVDKWPDHRVADFKGLDTDKEAKNSKKSQWIEPFCGKQGDEHMLKNAASRLANIARSLNGCEPVIYISASPFVTGMGLAHPIENGFSWHHTLGVPYLAGSSIKGMMRAWARDWLQEEEEEIGRLFGRDSKDGTGAAGNIIIFDALPIEPPVLMEDVLTPHDGGWRIAQNPTEKNAPGDWISPVPIPFLAVASGASFQFLLAPRAGATQGDLKKAMDYLEQALEWIGIGAKTAVGFGRMLTNDKIHQRRSEEKEAAIMAKQNAPFSVGEIAYHEDEWQTVEILAISGSSATIYSRDEAQEAIVELEELQKK
ncbi:MAG: type III-B CRISPR module RAMP protein Cmr6 [Cohaesibacter sp.]|nr:type III-B CRISPR module RAMP protein Cmr6 [Cohaesibacter sp.]MCV6602706.1 type III-B CRISPR module RAMP protein Cmr6 [Cohaesibacter sp.]